MGYIDDLKEMVPAYVIVTVSGLAALIEAASINLPIDAAIAVWVMMVISVVVVAFIEGTTIIKETKLKLIRTIISMVNAGLWIITVNLYILNFPAVFEFWFRLGSALWTGFTPIVYEQIRRLLNPPPPPS